MPPLTTRTGTTTVALNLREGPELTAPVIAVLPPETEVTILERHGDWLQVTVNGQGGYVFAAFVKLPPETPGTGTTTAALNLREGPGREYTVLTVLPAETPLTILGEQDDWFRVTVNGQEGWVNKGFVLLPGQKILAGFLVSTPGLLDTPLVPAERLVPPSGASAEAVIAASIWNRFGGMLADLSTRLGIDPAVAVAVMAAESGGRGFDDGGRMIIRFENHIFWQQWGRDHPDDYHAHFRYNSDEPWKGHRFRSAMQAPWEYFHEDQDWEWSVFEFACGLDEAAARKSISMGLPQIMGFNHAAIGYETVHDMFEAFGAGERHQVVGLFDFIQGSQTVSRRVIALQQSDFVTFASLYNGAGQAPRYAGIIQGLADAFHTLKQP